MPSQPNSFPPAPLNIHPRPSLTSNFPTIPWSSFGATTCIRNRIEPGDEDRDRFRFYGILLVTSNHQRWIRDKGGVGGGGQVGRCLKESIEYNLCPPCRCAARQATPCTWPGCTWARCSTSRCCTPGCGHGGDEGGGGGDVDGGDNDEYRHAVPSPVVANSWLITLISFSFSHSISCFCLPQPWRSKRVGWKNGAFPK